MTLADGDWPKDSDNPVLQAAEASAGVVIASSDVQSTLGLPGFLTDIRMRPLALLRSLEARDKG